MAIRRQKRPVFAQNLPPERAGIFRLCFK